MSQDQPTGGVDEQKAIIEAPEDANQSEEEQRQAVSEYSQSTKDKLNMKVHVYSPFNDYYDGLAFSLTAQSATGPFDILPRHHNFISLLEACELIIRTVGQGEQRIRIAGGLIHVKANEVIIFLDV